MALPNNPFLRGLNNQKYPSKNSGTCLQKQLRAKMEKLRNHVHVNSNQQGKIQFSTKLQNKNKFYSNDEKIGFLFVSSPFSLRISSCLPLKCWKTALRLHLPMGPLPSLTFYSEENNSSRKQPPLWPRGKVIFTTERKRDFDLDEMITHLYFEAFKIILVLFINKFRFLRILGVSLPDFEESSYFYRTCATYFLSIYI